MAVFVLPLFINSCVPSKPVEEEQMIPAEILIKKLEANRRKIKTFAGNGVLEINSPQIDAKASFEVTLKKPDSIRISIYGPFGIDLAQALVTKNDFYFYDVIKNQLYTGEVKDEVLKRIFKVDLSFDDLMDAFAGAVNLTDKLRREPDQFEPVEETYYLTYFNPGNTESIYEINNSDLAIINYRLLQKNSDLIFEGLYSDFRLFDDVPVPYKTIIENRETKQRIRIEYRNIEINSVIEDLTLTYPKDVEWIRL